MHRICTRWAFTISPRLVLRFPGSERRKKKLQNSWMHAAAQLARERAVDGFVPVFDGCGHPLAQRSRVAWVINRSCSTQADPPTRMGHKPLLLSAGRPTWSYTAPALGRPTTRFVNAHSIEASYSARHSHSSELTLLSFGVSRPARVCVYSIL